MKVGLLNPIESSVEEIIESSKGIDLIDILTASGQVLGHNLIDKRIDQDMNIVTLAPLIRLLSNELDYRLDSSLTFEKLRELCRKAASLNVIRKSGDEINGDTKFTEDDKVDYLVRNTLFQGHNQEDISQVVSRLHIMTNDIQNEWGQIDIDKRFMDNFGLTFAQLHTLFMGIASILMKDKSKFPGIDFNFYFEKATSEIKGRLEEIKKNLIEKCSIKIEDFKTINSSRNFKYDDSISLSTCLYPLEEKPFVQISDSRFILPIPQFLINRMADIVYMTLNQHEIELREEQGKTNKYKTDFSQKYGNVLEEYCRKVFSSIDNKFESEPPYSGEKNKGPDIVIPSKGLILEISKLVPNKSLRNYSGEKELKECYQKVVGKFKQSFNWHSSYDFKYKGIFPSNVLYVVITAESFPATQFKFGRSTLLDLVSEKWSEVSKKNMPSVLLISVSEFEILCTVSFNHNTHIRELLDLYVNYLQSVSDLDSETHNFKFSLKEFLLNRFDIQGKHLKIHSDAYEGLMIESKKFFFEVE